jgi:ABC-2 type transport system ATP-binding protein
LLQEAGEKKMSGDNLRDSIVLEKVKKSFGKHQVLKDVNGNIPEGTTVGILGRNGEGKTTLFKIMLDILAADEGKIRILNHPPDGSSRIRTIAGYVPERPMFHSFMNVDDVFKFRSRLFPNWDNALVHETARALDLDLSTRIKGASKGTLAKTAWICATAHHPKVLILDEPTSGLDPIVRDALLSQCVREQSTEGKTIVIASHHLEEWLNLLDEIWVMSGGSITGKYKLQDLRENAFRITGRLKNDSMPTGLSIVEEFRTGDIVQWLTIDPSTREKIQSLSILDQMDAQPLPLESALKLLLQTEDTNHVR